MSDGELMWQKECLLQIGIDAAVARGDRHIVLADADLIFTTSDAWSRISATFEIFDWFQPFETATLGYAEGAICKVSALSFANPVHYGVGHPGCAWAGTAEFFRVVRLYPFALLGGGDVVLTHLLATSWKHGASSQRFSDLTEYICNTVLYPELAPSILDWAKGHGIQRFRLGHTAGVHIQAIDHGSFASRRYHDRYACWRQAPGVHGRGPIPGHDLEVSTTGLLAWLDIDNGWKPVVEGYFKGRT